jgi:hypothetical protein
MNSKEVAIELLEKFDTKRDALLSIDMLMIVFVGEQKERSLIYWSEVKKEIIKILENN